MSEATVQFKIMWHDSNSFYCDPNCKYYDTGASRHGPVCSLFGSYLKKGTEHPDMRLRSRDCLYGEMNTVYKEANNG